MSQGIFGIGNSALQAYQRALQVTGHNIANVGTEGYSRQRLELGTRAPELMAFGAIGSGVQTTGVIRVADQFVQLRIGTATSAASYQRTLHEFSRSVDDLLGDSNAGLATSMQRFFAAVQDVATDPASIAARQQLIAEAGTLTDRFAQIEGSLADQRAIVNGRIRTGVDEINQITAGIAQLNREIVEARGVMSGRSPNDLLDQRERLVNQLAERVSVNTVVQDDGALNVYMGRGQPLVMGTAASTLYAQAMGNPPDRLDVAIHNGRSMVVVTDYIDGGQLGALLEVRDTVLDNVSNSLGRLAIGVAEAFNDQHARNMDLRGVLGETFFGWSMPAPIPGAGNAATGTPVQTLEDPSGLVASDYEMRFDGTEWSVRRLADGRVVGTAAAGESVAFDGLQVDLAAVAGAAQGDHFLLRPLRVAAGLDVRVTDPRAVAAALPVTAEPGAANGGSVSVHALSVLDATDAALRTPAQVQFTGGAFVVDGASFVPAADGETTIEANGWRLVLRGTPAEGDVVNLRDNSGAVGDNRGALALAGLANQRLLAGGTATFGETYGQLVADVGVKTRRAEINADVQARMLQSAQNQREAISGVNLDEEAANMLRYQQAYQAAAQVISVANSLFETLLAAVRR